MARGRDPEFGPWGGMRGEVERDRQIEGRETVPPWGRTRLKPSPRYRDCCMIENKVKSTRYGVVVISRASTRMIEKQRNFIISL